MRKLFIGLGMILSCWSYVSAQPDIVALEYYFDSDPGPGGGEVIDLDMEDQDTAVNLKITIPQLTMEGLEEGFHVLVVRFKDSQGDWSVAFT
ncbi:MAG: hypothetical protein KJT03_09830, partial [Verrucomicrobiae bacterium]|nr:hypothetical protein [Verrucomicrobiae bacterium]